MISIGEKIQLLRKKKGMSQEDLANLLNVSRQAVQKWESNQSTPELNKLVEMSNMFEVSLDYLVKDTEESKTTSDVEEQKQKDNVVVAIQAPTELVSEDGWIVIGKDDPESAQFRLQDGIIHYRTNGQNFGMAILGGAITGGIGGAFAGGYVPKRWKKLFALDDIKSIAVENKTYSKKQGEVPAFFITDINDKKYELAPKKIDEWYLVFNKFLEVPKSVVAPVVEQVTPVVKQTINEQPKQTQAVIINKAPVIKKIKDSKRHAILAWQIVGCVLTPLAYAAGFIGVDTLTFILVWIITFIVDVILTIISTSYIRDARRKSDIIGFGVVSLIFINIISAILIFSTTEDDFVAVNKKAVVETPKPVVTASPSVEPAAQPKPEQKPKPKPIWYYTCSKCFQKIPEEDLYILKKDNGTSSYFHKHCFSEYQKEQNILEEKLKQQQKINEERLKYKIALYHTYNTYVNKPYRPDVKKRFNQLKDSALERLKKAGSKLQFESIVESFEHSLKEYKVDPAFYAKRKKKRIIILTSLAAFITVASLTIGTIHIVKAVNRKQTYEDAIATMESGDINSAMKAFDSLNGYKKSSSYYYICEGISGFDKADTEKDIKNNILKITKNGAPVNITYKYPSTNSDINDKSTFISYTQTATNKESFYFSRPTLKEGYSLERWIEPKASYKNGEVNLELLASFSGQYYEIVYYLYGGLNHPSNVHTYQHGVVTKLFNPTKDTSSFLGWYLESAYQNKIEEISADRVGNIVLHAKWGPILHNVVFKNYDNQILYETTCEHGADVAYKGPTPTREATAQYTWTFSGWNGSLTNIKQDTTLVAQYSRTTNQYTVTFKNYNGANLYQTTVAYGSSAHYVGSTPTKPMTDDYEYFFSGWDKSLNNIIEDTVFTAQYTSKERYLCSFVNYDETPLYSVRVTKGNNVTYNGPNPEKPQTETEFFSFSGWDKPLTNITDNTTFVAQFNTFPRFVTVTFKNYDGTVLEEKQIGYGEDAVYTGATPEKETDDTCLYVFNGWDIDFTNVTQDLIITAQYTSKEHHLRFEKTEGGYGVGGKESGSVLEDELYIIPHSYQGEPINQILASSFTNWNIKKVFIPSSITAINDYAFLSCTKLNEVIFEENSHLERIRQYAFYETDLLQDSPWDSQDGLVQMILPESVTRVDGDNLYLFTNKKTYQQKVFLIMSKATDFYGTFPSVSKLGYYADPLPSITGGVYWHYVNGVPSIWSRTKNW